MNHRVGNSESEVQIAEDWLVLDVGSGNHPHPRADVLLDKYLIVNDDRSGAPISFDSSRTLVIGDALNLPFVDHAFDFIIASHVLEHVDDPELFCEELMRVGRGGYIETPSKLCETFLGEPFHRYLVEKRGGTLIFKRKSAKAAISDAFYSLYYFGEARLGHRQIIRSRCLRPFLQKVSMGLRFFAHLLARRMMYVIFRWEGSFLVKEE